MDDDKQARLAVLRARSHIPATVFFEKIVPVLLIILGLVLLGMVVVGLAIILGYFRF